MKPSECPTEMAEAEEFQSRQRHMEEETLLVHLSLICSRSPAQIRKHQSVGKTNTESFKFF